jgi:DNA-binding transcriptional ArsR family regulator
MSQDRKKETTIKRQTLIDKETGEEFEASTVVEEHYDKDWGFDKVWLGHIMTMIEEIGNQKMKVIGWLIQSRDRRDNRLHLTQEMIAEGAGVSRTTVSRTLTALEEADILKKERNGVYQLNPDFIFYGGRPKRANIMFEYRDLAEDEDADKSAPNESKRKNGTPEPSTV